MRALSTWLETHTHDRTDACDFSAMRSVCFGSEYRRENCHAHVARMAERSFVEFSFTKHAWQNTWHATFMPCVACAQGGAKEKTDMCTLAAWLETRVVAFEHQRRMADKSHATFLLWVVCAEGENTRETCHAYVDRMADNSFVDC